MSKSEAIQRKTIFRYISYCIFPAPKKPQSTEFLTSNAAAHQLTNYSQQKIDEKAKISNPVVDSLDPETFEVAAKKQSLMWGSQQYRQPEQRE